MEDWIATVWGELDQGAPGPELAVGAMAEDVAPLTDEEQEHFAPPGELAAPILPEAAPEAERIPEVGFVVSIAKSGWRRLHRLGGCARHPGVHYLNYELLGLDRPDVGMYADFCRQCWRGSDPQEPSDEEDSDSEEDDDEDNAQVASAEEPVHALPELLQ